MIENKNFMRLVTFAIATMMCLVVLSQVSADCPSGMVAYWKFDEGIGSTASDETTNNNDGTIHGATWTNGVVGNALNFDGVDDYVQVSDSSSLRPATFTLESWIKPDSQPRYSRILEKFWGDGVGNRKFPYLSYSLVIREVYAYGSISFIIGDGTNIYRLHSVGEAITNGVWTHVAATYDGNYMRLYINGVEDSNSPLSVTTTIAYSSDVLYVGARIDPQYPVYFDGLIDEVAIHDVVLSANEISEHYCLGYNFGHGYCDPPSLTYTGSLVLNMAQITLEATLKDSDGSGMSGYTIEFFVDGGSVGTADTDTNGIASKNIDTMDAGVYEVTASVYCLESDPTLIAVYDPNAGFVTGGGWIDSPAGAYKPDPELTGKANFGFVSKYKKGKQEPIGNTEFQFKAGDLNFHSTEYEWLIVAGCHAKFKGNGTINGEGNFGFMVTATDGEINGGGGVDKFRIKIWDKDDGDTIVYDNNIDEYGTALGGGQIKIHEG